MFRAVRNAVAVLVLGFFLNICLGANTTSGPAPTDRIIRQQPVVSQVTVAPTPAAAPSRASETSRTLTVVATAYTYSGHRTFTGTVPSRGTVAVDPKVIPLGTRLWVEGYGPGVAVDTGGAIRGRKVDLFMESRGECLNFGRRVVMVRILGEGE